MYRVALCDDTIKDIDRVRLFIQETLRNLDEVEYEFDCYQSAELFLHAHDKIQGKNRKRYDLVFCDVMFGETNGIEMLKSLMEQGFSFRTVFISAYQSFVFNSFDLKPLRYLVKPVQQKDIEVLIRNDYRENYLPKILAIECSAGVYRIDLNNVLYIENKQRKSRVTTVTGEKYVVPIQFKELIEYLPDDLFVRSHCSYVANLSKIEHIERYKLFFDDGSHIPISKSHYDRTKDKFFNYIYIYIVGNDTVFPFDLYYRVACFNLSALAWHERAS